MVQSHGIALCCICSTVKTATSENTEKYTQEAVKCNLVCHRRRVKLEGAKDKMQLVVSEDSQILLLQVQNILRMAVCVLDVTLEWEKVVSKGHGCPQHATRPWGKTDDHSSPLSF
jgi:hypothetical protein